MYHTYVKTYHCAERQHLSDRLLRPLESDYERVELNREQHRNILSRFEHLEKVLEKAEETIEKQNRITDRLTKELKKMKSTHQLLSSPDSTAGVGSTA